MPTLLEKIENEPRTHARLSDYIKIKHGFAFKGEYFSARSTKDVLVTPGNFAIGGGFKGEKYKYYAGPVPEDYILHEGDLVVTMTDLSVNADTLGYSALIPKIENVRFLHNQRIGLVQKINDGIDMGFLYFLMRTKEYQSYVVGGASGSTVKHTSPDRIASFEFDFPALSVQQKIAQVLLVYEDKIRNNELIINKLEETAQAIFDEWFVNFRFPGHEKTKFIESEMGQVPEGWNVGTISEIANVVMGQSPSSDHYNNLKQGMPFHQGVTHFDDRYPTNEIYSTGGEKKAQCGDILLSVRAPVGRINIANTDMVIGRGLSSLRSKEGQQSFLFYLLKNLFHKEDSFGSGSIFPAINKNELAELRILVPRDELVKQFERKSSNFDEEIKSLTMENTGLKQARDLLLKKMI